MFINAYAVLLILSILNLVALVYLGRKQNLTIYLLLFGSITISIYGAYTISTATIMDVALIGHRLVYAGGVFIPSIILICVARLCKIKIPKPFSIGLLIISAVILYFAYNVDNQTYYYNSISLETHYQMTWLNKEYGPVHIIYPLFLIGSVVGILGLVLYSHIWKRDVSRKVSMCLLIMDILSIALYFFQKIFDIPFEIFNVAYIIDEIIILFLIRRIGMYEVSESIAHSIEENSTYGYIILDNKLRYMGSNSTAQTFLDEINNLNIDEYLSETNTALLYNKLTRWFEDPKKTYSFSLETKDRILRGTTKELFHGNHKNNIGYYIELIDTTQQQKYLQLLNNYNATLEEEVSQKTDHIEMLQDKLILGMSDMIENRDSNTGGHVKRTSLAIRIFTDELSKHADRFSIDEQFLKNIVKAAPMHDLGKIAVDDRILRKPGKFTPEEFEEMKTHSEKGAKIISQILDGIDDKDFYGIAVNVAHYHHEKYNGQGYPNGLSGQDIPIEARIMALVDVFDALVSKRCYKEKMNFDDAFNIIKDSLGSHFDPDLGELFLKCRLRLENFYNGIEENDDEQA